MNNPFEPLLNEMKELNKKFDTFISKPKEDLSNKRYSIKESARRLDVIPLTIRNHIKSGKIKAEKLGRKYYIKHSELYNALNEVKSLKYKR
jgi:excisionase family DNA binding protein